MKLLVTYPKDLKSKVLADLVKAKDKADAFNIKTQSGKLGKLIGLVGRKLPAFSMGVRLNYEWSDVTDSSLKLTVNMTGEGFIKDSIIVNTIKKEFANSYGREKVRVRLLLDRGEEK